MKGRLSKDILDIKTKTVIRGRIIIGGRPITIGPNSVPSLPGATREDLIQGLKKASKDKVFPIRIENE